MKVELPHDLTNLPKQIGQSVSHRIWELQLQKVEKYDLSLACNKGKDVQENWGKTQITRADDSRRHITLQILVHGI